MAVRVNYDGEGFSKEQNLLLLLIRKSLLPEMEVAFAEENADVAELAKLIVRNGILLTVYPTAGKVIPKLQELLETSYYASLWQNLLQEREGDRIISKLNEHKWDFIMLKGWKMREWYPAKEMREMADLDVLVRNYRYDGIKSALEELGYDSLKESGWKHDDFKKDKVTVEMHKRLTDDSGMIRQWEKNLWERCTQVSDYRYEMSEEDFYLFHLIHLHKDFMNGSLGLRRIVDTWLLQKRDIREDAIRPELEKMGLSRFQDKMTRLSRVLMGEEEMDEDSRILLCHAFQYGIYVSDKSYKAGRIAAMGSNLKRGKAKSRLAAIFLPYKRMRAQFPVLEKWPALLPFYWGKRILEFTLRDPDKSRQRLDYHDISEKDFEEMKRFFEAGGVR